MCDEIYVNDRLTLYVPVCMYRGLYLIGFVTIHVRKVNCYIHGTQEVYRYAPGKFGYFVPHWTPV